MSATDWARSFEALGGMALTSRYTQKKTAATDHCYGVIRRCPLCHENYFLTKTSTHDCQPKDAA